MKNVKYKNRKIEYSEAAKPEISIDGDSIHVIRDEEADELGAAELPYRTFKSAKELAQAVVDERLQQE